MLKTEIYPKFLDHIFMAWVLGVKLPSFRTCVRSEQGPHFFFIPDGNPAAPALEISLLSLYWFEILYLLIIKFIMCLVLLVGFLFHYTDLFICLCSHIGHSFNSCSFTGGYSILKDEVSPLPLLQNSPGNFCKFSFLFFPFSFLTWTASAQWASHVAQWVKNQPANARDETDAGLILGSGRSPGGGNGNPLQDSCLENPMDRGAWRATVHGVTKSQTWLSSWGHVCKLAWCFPHLSACNISESLFQVCVHGVIFSFKSGGLYSFFLTHGCVIRIGIPTLGHALAFCHLSLSIFYDTSLLASVWYNIADVESRFVWFLGSVSYILKYFYVLFIICLPFMGTGVLCWEVIFVLLSTLRCFQLWAASYVALIAFFSSGMPSLWI